MLNCICREQNKKLRTGMPSVNLFRTPSWPAPPGNKRTQSRTIPRCGHFWELRSRTRSPFLVPWVSTLRWLEQHDACREFGLSTPASFTGLAKSRCTYRVRPPASDREEPSHEAERNGFDSLRSGLLALGAARCFLHKALSQSDQPEACSSNRLYYIVIHSIFYTMFCCII